MRCLSVCKSAIGRYTMCAGLMAGLGMAITATTAMADTPVYDAMTGQTTGNFSSLANVANPAGSGTRQVGTPITLSDPNLREITGFDLTWGNITTTTITLNTTHRLRLNYWLWNTASVSNAAGTPAFSTLAGSGQIVFAPAAPIVVANAQFVNFLSAAPTAVPLRTCRS